MNQFYLFIRNFISSFRFRGSKDYWSRRYDSGGNSGIGSKTKLAEFKAEIINEFVGEFNIKSVIEFGCGDGMQLKLANYKSYIGYDISSASISMCDKLFSGDKTKSFKLMEEYNGEIADLALSLDVIYHLVEEDIYHAYMDLLFKSSTKYVIIYSTNNEINPFYQSPHVKHRIFTNWIDDFVLGWELFRYIPNKYPANKLEMESSAADFYIYRKLG